jgi:hypothetical protein
VIRVRSAVDEKLKKIKGTEKEKDEEDEGEERKKAMDSTLFSLFTL